MRMLVPPRKTPIPRAGYITLYTDYLPWPATTTGEENNSRVWNVWAALRVAESMKIEIWSDVACPWCYIGKRRFETALAQFPHRDSVDIEWKSYQLDPSIPEHYDGTELDYLSKRKGMAPEQVKQMFAHVTETAKGEGLDYHFEKVVVANSFTAHRLIHLAAAHGRQDAAKEQLLSDHFEHGKDIGSKEYLTELGAALDLPEDEVAELFTSDKYADEVNQDINEARAIGVTGVPFFVIDRKYGISGAQPADLFSQALNQAWQEANPLIPVGASDAEACGPDGCAI
ncbi:DSBA oxidoreductase [Arthrobacter sp. StoSoilB22]|nr:DSBA oxidoreductase [Arthrobacter sp. StoSoilB22]